MLAYTANWSRIGGTTYWLMSGSKTHAFIGFDHPYISSYEITLCGVEFKARSENDKLRAAARGHLTREGSYVVDVGKDLDEVDCKRCQAALAKLKREETV